MFFIINAMIIFLITSNDALINAVLDLCLPIQFLIQNFIKNFHLN